MSSSCFHIFSASAASFGSIPAKGPGPLPPLCVAMKAKGHPSCPLFPQCERAGFPLSEPVVHS